MIQKALLTQTLLAIAQARLPLIIQVLVPALILILVL